MSTSRGRVLVAMARNESLMSTVVKSKSVNKNKNDDPTFSSPCESDYEGYISSSCHSSNLPLIARIELQELQNIDFDRPNNFDNINTKSCDTDSFQQSVDLDAISPKISDFKGNVASSNFGPDRIAPHRSEFHKNFEATLICDQKSNVDINSINEFIYIPDQTNYSNSDINIADKNGADLIIESANLGDSLTNEDAVLPSSYGFQENKKISVIQNILILPAQTLSNEGQINQKAASTPNEIGDEDIMKPSSSTLVTKKGKPRKRRTISTPLAERKKAKKDEKRKAYYVKPPCSINCRKQCISNIPENRRIQINDEFWNLSWNEQRQFILNNTQRLNVKRPTNIIDKAVRQNTYTYHLKNESGRIFQVRKPFFLTTLGFKPSNDKVVHNALNMSVNNITFKRDKRGKKPSTKKQDRTKIRLHIESYHPSISHYRREHAPNRRYLPPYLSIAAMCKEFNKVNPNLECSYDVYRSVLSELNISFAKLGHEECEICEMFRQHEHTRDNLQAECNNCTVYSCHIDRAEKSRSQYREDSNISNRDMLDVCFSADLQKVIMLPRMDQFKIVLFTPRLVLFNESFVPVGVHQRHLSPIAALWHEGIAGRNKEDLISSFHAFFLKNRDATKITVWLDNCSAQNKNWCFFNFLIYIVNCLDVCASTIYMKYFEPGHTFMSADSFHHQVEQAMKRYGDICDYHDFKKAVQDANSERVSVISMKPNNFANWKDCTSQTKIKKANPRPYLNKIVQVCATRGKNTLQYWTDFNGEACELNFLTANAMKKGIQKPQFRSSFRGIPQNKKDTIVKDLCPLMPNNRKQFWYELPVNDVADLNVVHE